MNMYKKWLESNAFVLLFLIIFAIVTVIIIIIVIDIEIAFLVWKMDMTSRLLHWLAWMF